MYVSVKKRIETGEPLGSIRCGTCKYCAKMRTANQYWLECSLYVEEIDLDAMNNPLRCDECLQGRKTCRFSRTCMSNFYKEVEKHLPLYFLFSLQTISFVGFNSLSRFLPNTI